MALASRVFGWRAPFASRGILRSRTCAEPRHASTLATLVHDRARTAGSSLSLIAPQQDVSWTYEQLSERVVGVAGALSKVGYQKGDVVVTDLPNSVENLVLQIGCAHLGVAVATVKDAKALDALTQATRVRGVVTHQAEGATDLLKNAELPLPPVVVPALDGSCGPLGNSSSAELAPVEADAAAAMGYWSSTKPLTNREALGQMGADAQQKFAMSAADRVLVSITLCHAFGIGSAVGSALLAGAAVVLPGASGIRGCGSPSQRANVTLSVLESARCSLLFADIHTMKAVPPPGSADLSALRGGVCKVGSGADFLDDVKEAKIGPDGEMRPLEYAGVPFIALGKK